jgi:hypothetical protein
MSNVRAYLDESASLQQKAQRATSTGDAGRAATGGRQGLSGRVNLSFRRNFVLSSGEGRRGWRHHAKPGGGAKGGGSGGVHLLDFTKLRIKADRMLGMGSTARVYEGTWLGTQRCAVKVSGLTWLGFPSLLTPSPC